MPSSALELIRAERVIGIVRKAPDVDAAVESLVAAGLRIVEITLDAPDALAAIERWHGRATLLAGTVRLPEQVDAAAAAGAEAIVAPGFSGEVVARARELGLPAMPGALTPTEVERAWRAGASLVKLFPAATVGPGYVRAVLAPLADVPLVVTGGITAENAAAFLAAGAVAVGADVSRASAILQEVRKR